HTRWATHGRPSERNAHPILDTHSRVAVIHNGIIENFSELRAEMRQEGWEFATDTDTEVVANLISAELEHEPCLLSAVRGAMRRLLGHYAFAAVTTACDGEEIVVARHGPPLVLGLAAGEQFLASDPAALLPHTRDVIFLENGDVARLRPSGVDLCDSGGITVVRQVRRLDWDPVQIDRGGYRHYMLKEIHEQPRAVQATMAGRVCFESGRVDLSEIGALAARLATVRRIQVLACGTSWHAALIGKFLIEEIARLPVDVDYASEYRYRNPLVDAGLLTVGISQSGETADTLSAMELAKERGAMLLAVCNVAGSQATRLSDGVLLTCAGPEIGVASTKAFTTQLVALYLLALALRQSRGSLERSQVAALAKLPEALAQTLALETAIERLARRYLQTKNALYLGRGINYPIALE